MCFCRDPGTGKALGKQCPKLKKGHAKWYFRYEAPAGASGKRRQPRIGPFDTKTAAEEELNATLARIAGGGQVQDRSLTVGAYLAAYAVGKLDVKAGTRDSIHEAVRLYWLPGLGHLRLVDLRDHHISEVVRAMMAINKPPGTVECEPEVLRRLVDARADDVRRELAPGEKRHKKSPKPLSPARIARMFAVLRAAMNAAVPSKIGVNPCDTVNLPRVTKVRPLPWTRPRTEAFNEALRKRIQAASETAKPTTAGRRSCGAIRSCARPRSWCGCLTRLALFSTALRVNGCSHCSAWSLTAACAGTRRLA